MMKSKRSRWRLSRSAIRCDWRSSAGRAGGLPLTSTQRFGETAWVASSTGFPQGGHH